MHMRLFGGLAMASLLSGCAEFNSIYRKTPINPDDQAHVISVDAKQRHLLFNPYRQDKDSVKWRICAEAAPDVSSAYAASAAAKGDKSGGELSFGSSETAASIERTQTINLLRESFYRTCERYLSGAIDKVQFIVQAARDQRAMVAVLAIEQLTRTARPASTIISGPPTSASIKDGEAAAKLVDEFRKEAQASAASEAQAEADFAKADETGKCKDSDTPPSAESDEAIAAAKQAFATCLAAKATLAARKAANQQAQARLDQALKVAADTVTSVNALTQAGESSSGAGGSERSDAAIIAVAASVQEIALKTSIDEVLMFCIAYLTSRPDEGLSNEIVSTCLPILKERAGLDNAVLFSSFSADQTGNKISDYLDAPALAAERKRRREIAQTAARQLGLPENFIDLVNFIATAPAAEKQLLLDAMRALETNPEGMQALK